MSKASVEDPKETEEASCQGKKKKKKKKKKGEKKRERRPGAVDRQKQQEGGSERSFIEQHVRVLRVRRGEDFRQLRLNKN